jgi:hypothetical protein
MEEKEETLGIIGSLIFVLPIFIVYLLVVGTKQVPSKKFSSEIKNSTSEINPYVNCIILDAFSDFKIIEGYTYWKGRLVVFKENAIYFESLKIQKISSFNSIANVLCEGNFVTDAIFIQYETLEQFSIKGKMKFVFSYDMTKSMLVNFLVLKTDTKIPNDLLTSIFEYAKVKPFVLSYDAINSTSFACKYPHHLTSTLIVWILDLLKNENFNDAKVSILSQTAVQTFGRITFQIQVEHVKAIVSVDFYPKDEVYRFNRYCLSMEKFISGQSPSDKVVEFFERKLPVKFYQKTN